MFVRRDEFSVDFQIRLVVDSLETNDVRDDGIRRRNRDREQLRRKVGDCVRKDPRNTEGCEVDGFERQTLENVLRIDVGVLEEIAEDGSGRLEGIATVEGRAANGRVGAVHDPSCSEGRGFVGGGSDTRSSIDEER